MKEILSISRFDHLAYIDEPLDVSLLEVEEDRRVVEVGQVGHVLATVVLRRVHLGDQLLLVLLHLSSGRSLDDLHLDLVASGLLDHTLSELLLRVRHVGGPLGVVRLLCDPLLDLLGDEEEGGGVGVIPLV